MLASRLLNRAGLLLAIPGVGLLSGCFSLTINSQARPAPSAVQVIQAPDPFPVAPADTAPSDVRIVTLPGATGDYRLNVVCNSDEQTCITRVQVTDRATLVTFRTRSQHRFGSSIAVAPPGHELACYLQDADSTARYQLLGLEGIAVMPTRTQLAPGDTVEFTLRFERLDDSVRRFHMIEGTVEAPPGLVAWRFLDVPLR